MARTLRWILGAALAGATAAVAALALSFIPLRDHDARGSVPAEPIATRLLPATVTLTGGASKPVPSSFLGLSAEYWTLPIWEQHPGLLERVLALIQAPGDGPLVVRIGGGSADHAFWEATP